MMQLYAGIRTKLALADSFNAKIVSELTDLTTNDVVNNVLVPLKHKNNDLSKVIDEFIPSYKRCINFNEDKENIYYFNEGASYIPQFSSKTLFYFDKAVSEFEIKHNSMLLNLVYSIIDYADMKKSTPSEIITVPQYRKDIAKYLFLDKNEPLDLSAFFSSWINYSVSRFNFLKLFSEKNVKNASELINTSTAEKIGRPMFDYLNKEYAKLMS